MGVSTTAYSLRLSTQSLVHPGEQFEKLAIISPELAHNAIHFP